MFPFDLFDKTGGFGLFQIPPGVLLVKNTRVYSPVIRTTLLSHIRQTLGNVKF